MEVVLGENLIQKKYEIDDFYYEELLIQKPQFLNNHLQNNELVLKTVCYHDGELVNYKFGEGLLKNNSIVDGLLGEHLTSKHYTIERRNKLDELENLRFWDWLENGSIILRLVFFGRKLIVKRIFDIENTKNSVIFEYFPMSKTDNSTEPHQLKSVVFIKNDKWNGEFKIYHRNGALYLKAEYIDNETVGGIREWDSEGRLISFEGTDPKGVLMKPFEAF